MYKIGEFASLVGTNISTLRYYDEIDLLKPAYIDNFTNYRYYTDDNIRDYNKISILKNNGFNLEEILMYKDNLTEEVIDFKINDLEDKINVLESQIQNLKVLSKEITGISKEDDIKRLVYTRNKKNNVA